MTQILNDLLSVLFALCYGYQVLYIILVLLHRRRKQYAIRRHRFAVLCAARNEEAVIGELIRSVRQQDYPPELVDIYVVADNCTDGTAEAARSAGARVLERTDETHRGKGYALDALFQHLFAARGQDAYDAYLIFDADNVLRRDYLTAMNACLCQGHAIITSCRNTKNYGDNWISAAYGLWFLRESRFLNEARAILKTGAVVSGTGFLVRKDVVKELGGWPYHQLSEDTQFTLDQLIRGRRASYCPEAVFYDEQPTSFRQSVQQRLRWSKGYYQALSAFGTRLLRTGFSGYDILMTNLPALLLTLTGLGVNLTALVLSLCFAPEEAPAVCRGLLEFAAGYYWSILLSGGVTLAAEWKEIQAPAYRKLAFFPLFPLFMFTYLPISVAALFCRVEWTGIRHHAGKGSTLKLQ